MKQYLDTHIIKSDYFEISRKLKKQFSKANKALVIREIHSLRRQTYLAHLIH
jgi:hypothetical protein